MQTMSKPAESVRGARAGRSRPVARTAGNFPAGATATATRGASSLAERVRTLVDRTLDAARGRYEM